jgi:F-type H+-transporting ATPase subunit b
VDLSFNYTLLAQIFHFVLLLVLLRLFAYKPLLKVLADRQKYVADNIAAAEQEKAEAQRLKERHDAELKRVQEQTQEIMQKAARSAEEQAQQIIESARLEAGRLKDSALAQIQREKEKAMAELRGEVASLSILIAGKIIGRQLDDAVQHRMVEDFIKEAGELH